MLRLPGILTLGNLIFGGHRCRRHQWHRRGSFPGRSLLLGTLLGLFMSRANQYRTEEQERGNRNG